MNSSKSILTDNAKCRILEDGISRSHFYILYEPKEDFIKLKNREVYLGRKRRGFGEIVLTNSMIESWLKIEYLLFCDVNLNPFAQYTFDTLNKTPIYITDNDVLFGQLDITPINNMKLNPPYIPPFILASFLDFIEYHANIYGIAFIHILTIEYNYWEYYLTLIKQLQYNYDIFINNLAITQNDICLHKKMTELLKSKYFYTKPF